MDDLTTLAGRFAAASDRWPNLASTLITWPEDQPAPDDNLPIDMEGHCALPHPDPGDDAGPFWVMLPTSGARMDTPQGRYRDGRAGMLLLRRNFGRAFGDPREVDDPDEAAAFAERFRALAETGSRALDGIAPPVSPATMRWGGYTRWLLAIHETVAPEVSKFGAHYCETLPDVNLASAQAIDAWTAGRTDSKTDTEKKPQKKRRMNKAAWGVVRDYKVAKKTDPSETLKMSVENYVSANPHESAGGLYRRLTDNRAEWED